MFSFIKNEPRLVCILIRNFELLSIPLRGYTPYNLYHIPATQDLKVPTLNLMHLQKEP